MSYVREYSYLIVHTFPCINSFAVTRLYMPFLMLLTTGFWVQHLDVTFLMASVSLWNTCSLLTLPLVGLCGSVYTSYKSNSKSLVLCHMIYEIPVRCHIPNGLSGLRMPVHCQTPTGRFRSGLSIPAGCHKPSGWFMSWVMYTARLRLIYICFFSLHSCLVYVCFSHTFWLV